MWKQLTIESPIWSARLMAFVCNSPSFCRFVLGRNKTMLSIKILILLWFMQKFQQKKAVE
jgi:hypothetical protein